MWLGAVSDYSKMMITPLIGPLLLLLLLVVVVVVLVTVAGGARTTNSRPTWLSHVATLELQGSKVRDTVKWLEVWRNVGFPSSWAYLLDNVGLISLNGLF